MIRTNSAREKLNTRIFARSIVTTSSTTPVGKTRHLTAKRSS